MEQHYYFVPLGRSIAVSMFVCLCLSVCFFACVSKKQHVQTSWNCLHKLTDVAVARASSDYDVMYFRFCGWRNGPKSSTTLRFVDFARWRHRWRSCCTRLQACWLDDFANWNL